MARQDDISATEKLLEIIRTEGEPASPDAPILTMTNSPPIATGGETSPVAPPPSSPVAKTATTEDDQPQFFEKRPRPRPIRNPSTRILPKTVGVDIQARSISFVKASLNGKRAKVHDFRHLPLTDEAATDQLDFEKRFQNPGFRETLKKELASFCSEPKQCQIWCSLPRDFIDIHHLTIPPVPANEVANAIFWATKKHTTFDAENTILDFALLDGEKRTAIVFLAPKQTVLALKNLFADIGYPLTGITSPSIAYQNQIKQEWVPVPDSFALIQVEEHSSFIDMFHNGIWIFGREIKTGRKSFIDSIIEEAEARGSNIDERTAQLILYGGEMEIPAPMATAVDDILSLAEEKEPATGDFNLPAAERLVRQIERTFDYCVTTFGTPRATKIYIAGQLAASRLLMDSIGTESGLACAPADPYRASKKMLSCTVPPQDPKQSCIMNTAFGLAFAQTLETQNFLNTYQKRINSIQIIKINKIVLRCFAGIAVLICALFAFQHHHVNRSAKQLALLQKQLNTVSTTFANKINATLLRQASQEIKAGRTARKTLAQKYYQLGLVGEITRLLPTRVKLVRLAIEPVSRNPRQSATKKNRQVVLEGVVFGDERSREFVMSGLLQQLAGSPLVENASFLKKQLATTGGETVLHFSAAIIPAPGPMDLVSHPPARMKP